MGKNYGKTKKIFEPLNLICMIDLQSSVVLMKIIMNRYMIYYSVHNRCCIHRMFTDSIESNESF